METEARALVLSTMFQAVSTTLQMRNHTLTTGNQALTTAGDTPPGLPLKYIR